MKEILKRIKNYDVFSDSFFKAIVCAVFVCAFVVAVSQLGLKTASGRQYLTNIDKIESASALPVDSFAESNIVLYADGVAENSYILLNGERYAPLKNGENIVEIYTDSVVEIETASLGGQIEVAKISDNLKMYTKENVFILDLPIKIIARAGLKNTQK